VQIQEGECSYLLASSRRIAENFRGRNNVRRIELLFTVPHDYNIQVKAAEAPITKIVDAFHQCFENIPRVEVIVKYRMSRRVLTTGNLLSTIKRDGAETRIVTMPELVEQTYIVSLPDKTRVTRGRHDELLGFWLALGAQRKTTGRNEMV